MLVGVFAGLKHMTCSRQHTQVRHTHQAISTPSMSQQTYIRKANNSGSKSSSSLTQPLSAVLQVDLPNADLPALQHQTLPRTIM